MPYCATWRSNTDVTYTVSPDASVSLRAGTLRYSRPGSPGWKCGKPTETTSSRLSMHDSSASMSCWFAAFFASRFHLPSSPQRKPTEPFGAT